jgi:hypothetical protein
MKADSSALEIALSASMEHWKEDAYGVPLERC